MIHFFHKSQRNLSYTDLDSVASSIAYAWIQSEVHKKPTIPLIQLERDDLDLRAENIHALGLAGLKEPKEQLLYLTDLADIQPFPSHQFALVDHNRLGARYESPTAHVIAVIDHHDDEGLYKETANPRTIAPAGSCASHVASLCPNEVPAEIATLLLSAILIDTGGLKPGGKALLLDVHAAGFLASRSTFAPSLPSKLLASLVDDHKTKSDLLYETPAIRDLTATLSSKKGDVSHLSGRDLLRRDYKDYTFVLPWADNQSVNAGLSTVPLSLEAWGKDGKLEEAAISWMKDRNIVILGVLTSFRDGSKPGLSGKGKHRREMAWVVHDHGANVSGADGASNIDFTKLSTVLWKGLEDSGELKLKKHKKFDLEKAGKLPEGAKARVYNQGNADATRKVTAPLLRSILEAGPSKSEKK